MTWEWPPCSTSCTGRTTSGRASESGRSRGGRRPGPHPRLPIRHGGVVHPGVTDDDRCFRPDLDDDSQALVLAALAFEDWCEDQGWDQPTQLVEIRRVAEPREPDDPDVEFVELVGEGDLFDILAEVELSEHALALLLAAEIWAFPPDLPEDQWVGRPSEHPDRVEVRTVTVVDVDGHAFDVHRVRGDDEATVTAEVSGRLVDAVRAAALRRTGPGPHTAWTATDEARDGEER